MLHKRCITIDTACMRDHRDLLMITLDHYRGTKREISTRIDDFGRGRRLKLQQASKFPDGGQANEWLELNPSTTLITLQSENLIDGPDHHQRKHWFS